MNRIENAFKNKPIFMPYFPLGYPDLETSIDVIEALAKNGADLIEVGLSFSDPLADGPVIQKATQVALEHGITIKKSLAAVAELRKRGVTIPFILMGYFNPMLAYGLEKFVHDAREAGADGFIIPDLPLEEAGEFQSLVGDMPLIQMLAPTSPNERMESIARNAKGFIYLGFGYRCDRCAYCHFRWTWRFDSTCARSHVRACVCGIWNWHARASQTGWSTRGWSHCRFGVCEIDRE
ncbi:MAG: tryptophan synthase subunit alpha [Anaerolineales bacterium]|nr:tryptophan synthase subunit alpha [Anaerolineales bacterium]